MIVSGYLLTVVSTVLVVLRAFSLAPPWSPPWSEHLFIHWLLLANLAFFGWRIVTRLAFTAREYGWREGGMALMRIPVSNVIAIIAARRALIAYLRSLAGAPLAWDKTHHAAHPAHKGPNSAPDFPLFVHRSGSETAAVPE